MLTEIFCFLLLELILQVKTLAPIPPLLIDEQAIRNALDKSKTFRAQFFRKMTYGLGIIGLGIIGLAVIKLRPR